MEAEPRELTVWEAHAAADCPNRETCWAADIHDRYHPREATPSRDPVLVSALLDRTEKVESARMWAVALEARLAEVRTILTAARDTPADRRVRIRQALRLIDSDLQVAE